MLLDVSASTDAPLSGIAASLQRSDGSARVGFGQRSDGRTVLKTLYQSGAAKVRFPKTDAKDGAEAVLINTAGGVTGGDRFDFEVAADGGADVTVTTQACEKIYRAANGASAEIGTRLRVAAGSRLSWLPQECIVFDGGRLNRSLNVDLAGDAIFLGVESFLLGRRAMGEMVTTGSIRDRWRVYRDGKLIFADTLQLAGKVAALGDRSAILSGNTTFSTLVYCGGAPERFLDQLREVVGEFGAASTFNGKLVVRIACPKGMQLRSILSTALEILRENQPLPRIWRT